MPVGQVASPRDRGTDRADLADRADRGPSGVGSGHVAVNVAQTARADGQLRNWMGGPQVPPWLGLLGKRSWMGDCSANGGCSIAFHRFHLTKRY